MRKIASVVIIFLAFILIYLLQANFFNWFTIAGVKPNLFVILIVFVGLFAGKYMGVSIGVVAGLLLDFFISKKIGISAIMFGIIGLLGGILDNNFSKDSKLTIIIIIFGTTALYEIGNYVINAFIYNYEVEIVNFAIQLGIEIIYNIILTIILYPLIQRAGNLLENIFKGNRILTRYF
ncbi:MAG TPA: rod shape-determining protein MreD [Candidatus Merdicola faecigallinarum]|uniref:Rod shape-determining protein MreD n=1 Tax=Candidatus Merdicola faecigallinarum TaxID=2840862 RepID=A0A9D1M160_9FIRM|nr:rod shape-determining protein MreD [Candidatus Merdicola faecigallinarum]